MHPNPGLIHMRGCGIHRNANELSYFRIKLMVLEGNPGKYEVGLKKIHKQICGSKPAFTPNTMASEVAIKATADS